MSTSRSLAPKVLTMQASRRNQQEVYHRSVKKTSIWFLEVCSLDSLDLMLLESACKFQTSTEHDRDGLSDAPPLQVPQILSWRFLVALRLCRATNSEESDISQHCLALGTSASMSVLKCLLF